MSTRTLWSESEIQFVKENHATMSLVEMSRYLPGRSAKAIWNKIKAGLVKREYRQQTFNGDEIEFIKNNYDTMILSDIGIHLKTSSGSIYRALKKLGLRRIRKTPSGYLPSKLRAERLELSNCKDRARERGHEWAINNEYFFHLIKQNCYYCGIAPYRIRKAKGATALVNGVDRLDSKRGYVPDNCVPCCKVCNIAKLAMSENEFYSWVSRIHRHLSSTNRLQVLSDPSHAQFPVLLGGRFEAQALPT